MGSFEMSGGPGASVGRLVAAKVAQSVAQALTVWALLGLFLESGWTSCVLLLAALLVPFRTDGSARDRAAGNFASALLVWGILIARLYGVFLDTIIGEPGDTMLTTFNFILLTMTVLYVFAGAFFWVEREKGHPE